MNSYKLRDGRDRAFMDKHREADTRARLKDGDRIVICESCGRVFYADTWRIVDHTCPLCGSRNPGLDFVDSRDLVKQGGRLVARGDAPRARPESPRRAEDTPRARADGAPRAYAPDDAPRRSASPTRRPGGGLLSQIPPNILRLAAVCLAAIVLLIILIVSVKSCSAPAAVPSPSPTPTLEVTPTPSPTPTPEPVSVSLMDQLPADKPDGFYANKWDAASYKEPLKMDDATVEQGIGWYVPTGKMEEGKGTSSIVFELGEGCTQFTAKLGLDSDWCMGSPEDFGTYQVVFSDQSDNVLFDSGVCDKEKGTQEVSFSLQGVQTLRVTLSQAKGAKGTYNVILAQPTVLKAAS
ncbi:MAG: NPCBM/NEW2 domain-containing protein [Christensenellales bacterium]